MNTHLNSGLKLVIFLLVVFSLFFFVGNPTFSRLITSDNQKKHECKYPKIKWDRYQWPAYIGVEPESLIDEYLFLPINKNLSIIGDVKKITVNQDGKKYDKISFIYENDKLISANRDMNGSYSYDYFYCNNILSERRNGKRLDYKYTWNSEKRQLVVKRYCLYSDVYWNYHYDEDCIYKQISLLYDNNFVFYHRDYDRVDSRESLSCTSFKNGLPVVEYGNSGMAYFWYKWDKNGRIKELRDEENPPFDKSENFYYCSFDWLGSTEMKAECSSMVTCKALCTNDGLEKYIIKYRFNEKAKVVEATKTWPEGHVIWGGYVEKEKKYTFEY